MTIYLDVSAAVNSRAGLGRYAHSLANALIAELEAPPTLFYNRTGQARHLSRMERRPAALDSPGLQTLAHGCLAGATGASVVWGDWYQGPGYFTLPSTC